MTKDWFDDSCSIDFKWERSLDDLFQFTFDTTENVLVNIDG